MKPLKLTLWPALALCLTPVCAYAALIPLHPPRLARSVPPVVRHAEPGHVIPIKGATR